MFQTILDGGYFTVFGPHQIEMQSTGCGEGEINDFFLVQIIILINHVPHVRILIQFSLHLLSLLSSLTRPQSITQKATKANHNQTCRPTHPQPETVREMKPIPIVKFASQMVMALIHVIWATYRETLVLH